MPILSRHCYRVHCDTPPTWAASVEFTHPAHNYRVPSLDACTTHVDEAPTETHDGYILLYREGPACR